MSGLHIDRRRMLKLGFVLAASGGLPARAFAQAVAGAKRLLFIHGRAQEGKNPNVLKVEWLDAMKRGMTAIGTQFPSGVDVAFPYYGDRLYEFARQFEIPLTSDVHARGRDIDDEFLVFQAEFAEDVRKRAGVTDAQVDTEYGGDPMPRGPLNWKWVQAILRAIDKSGTGMNSRTLEAFTRDVFLYTTRAGVRTEIDKIVSSAMTAEPTVVVAHSLGTVVAYSVLQSDPRALRVPLCVTVGSPLGVRAVRDQFRPLSYPRPVGKWYNAFDTRDVVALYPLDGENFPVQPAIENSSTVKNSTENRHGIAGYLDDRGVVKRISDALRPI